MLFVRHYYLVTSFFCPAYCYLFHLFRCDRILSYGKGIRLLKYRRIELKMSDHRPVTATYMAEVEVFSPRKLQRALTFTDAEVENADVVAEWVSTLEQVSPVCQLLICINRVLVDSPNSKSFLITELKLITQSLYMISMNKALAITLC